MSIDLSKINYFNPNLVFVTTGKKIEDKAIADNQPANGIIDVRELINGYGEVFAQGQEKLNGFLRSLTIILNMGNGNESILGIDTINNKSKFYTSAQTISGKTIDSICLEGYRAYSFYLEKIILLLNKLNDAIKQGQAAIKKISDLSLENMPADQTVEEYVNSKVHELSAELYLADKAIADVEAEFGSCLRYNANTKSWDKQYDLERKLDTYYRYYNIQPDENNGKLYGGGGTKITIDILRTFPIDNRQITCFSEFNLLDRLCYIRYYYELIFNNGDSNYQVFPNDSEKGYPCIPDKKSTTDTKATESMGGFELFYVGYLVDRDGSIDAYSSCLEAKSKAITDNISLQSEHIEAYNQYLTFINRATQLLNQSQSGGTAAIAHGAHLGLTYFCGGTMRDLLEVDGVNYIVLSYTDKDGSKDSIKAGSDFNYGYNHRYLLVRADEKGLDALYYNSLSGKDDPSKPSDPNSEWEDTGKKLELTTAEDLKSIFEKKTECVLDCGYSSLSFEGTNFYRRAWMDDNSIWPLIVASSEENREILIWDMVPNITDIDDLNMDVLNKEAKSKYEKNYNSLSDDEKKEVIGIVRAEKYLPKQLIIQEIEPDSVAAYEAYNNYSKTGWGYDGEKESAEEANRVINSWTSAFSNKSEYINTAIETINTDITALRTKMDTIDSLCSTLRNRSFETKKTLISNLRS